MIPSDWSFSAGTWTLKGKGNLNSGGNRGLVKSYWMLRVGEVVMGLGIPGAAIK